MKKLFRLQAVVCLLTLGGACTQVIAQGLEGYTLKKTTEIGNVTKKIYVQEDDFGNVKQSCCMWEKKRPIGHNILYKPFKSVWVSRGRVTSITNF